jgi:hypothetical protein
MKLGLVGVQDVNDPVTFAQYVQQRLGTPYPNYKQLPVLRKTIKTFFEAYPNADYGTLVRLTNWARDKKKRPAHSYQLIGMVRYAWSDGALPELDPKDRVDPETEAAIEAALKIEKDEAWRKRLMMATGIQGRQEVYAAWKNHAEQLSS